MNNSQNSSYQSAQAIYKNSWELRMKRITSAIGTVLAISTGGVGGYNAITNESGDGVQPANTVLSVLSGTTRTDHYEKNPSYIKGDFAGPWEHTRTSLDGRTLGDIEKSILVNVGNPTLATLGIGLLFFGLRTKRIKLRKGEIFDANIEGFLYTTTILGIENGIVKYTVWNHSKNTIIKGEASVKKMQELIERNGLLYEE